jgi:DNA processing protein
MNLTNDSFALVLLCTHLGLPEDPKPKPLTTKEWVSLELKLAASAITPGDLSELPAGEIAKALNVADEDAQRLASLFSRSGLVEQELAELESAGIWIATRLDDQYPQRFIDRLGAGAPVLLYGAGNVKLLNRRGLAVVGSRNIDSRSLAVTEFVGKACAESNLTVYSGGARGVDKTAMGAGLNAGGTAAGLLADSLARGCRASDAREFIEDGKLVLATHVSPYAGFTIGTAMARNKLIYALSDYALVIASDAEKGGTWAGAEEALKAEWVPVFVLNGTDVPEGNRLLIKRGGIPFPESMDARGVSLESWLDEHVPMSNPTPTQGSLF